MTQTELAQTSTTTQVIHPPFDFPIGDLREHELLLVVSIATAHKDLILERQKGSLEGWWRSVNEGWWKGWEMDRVQATSKIRKRKAENQDNERLSKRMSLLNLGLYSSFYVEV